MEEFLVSFPAILALEDGSIFYGEGFGEEKIDVGELVFNTSMTGYQEIITILLTKNKLLPLLTLILAILVLMMKIMNHLQFMLLGSLSISIVQAKQLGLIKH